MTVRVKLFAAARELAGASEVAVEVRDGATLADVERALLTDVPTLKSILPHARWAVNAEFATSDAAVAEQSEIALIPPVSGG
jgi:molybdopterin synthase sulfur carrier subunit